MLRLIVLFLYVCVCGDALANAVGHANSLAKSTPKKMGSYKTCVALDGKGTDDNEVLWLTKADGKTVNFVCEKSLCGDDSHVAILGKGCIRNGDKCYENRWFYCSISLLDDAWLVAKDFNKREEKLNLCSEAGDNFVLTNIVNSHKAIIVGNEIYEDYYIDNVASSICWAYVCDDGFVLNADKSACEKIICNEGATQQTGDCDDIFNARQCTQKCVGGTRWEFQSLNSCVDGYRVENASCVVDIKVGDDCKGADLSGLNASAGTYQMIGGQLKCVATTCKSGAYKIKKNDVYQGYCVYDTCSDGQKLKIDGEYTDGTCEAIAVEKPDENIQENSTVVESATEENETDGNADENGGGDAVAVPDAATVSEETVPPVGDGTTGGESESNAAVDTNESEINAKQAEDRYQAQQESQEKIDELQGKAKSAKDRERSTENKLLGAAGIGATGVGGMMLASGLAEQKADADAENAMRAYLSTFTCSYGNGKNVRGGETNIELPGGNDLIALYAEYVNLANDLKARKEALGMRPGIEAETILDSATSGLYDDVAVGKTGGAYVSLARALADPDGADAKAWAAQKDESADKKKTGAITAGVGAGGALVGDLIINSGDDKKCSDGYEWDTDKKECVKKK